ncbi:phosphatidylinositol 3- and 4-kinase [Toxoplasma gondii ME49]|uniref:Phosphatidylinositol 3-and 4-kinase n=1 Tax=Toxoplasma gondii (strain ATCC 50611 / Me49) TaxID=508771 RepID=S8F7T2_TOXGM|nr:phosphatidylinositol 3- and 4-kinase [Toxoplasma gondii ME49]EPT31931.1 phosphatidylinositol 3- and 4-kinase [Toxoplasma gondii ME49]|eukprot:XP_018638245.1 phosphatidylinositol 3- and 4-kinase [Toxoplasma gondii ME49]
MACAKMGEGGGAAPAASGGLASHPLYYYSTHNALRAAEGAENFFPVTFVELHGTRTCKINVYPFCDVQMVKRILLKKMNLSSCMKVRDIRLLYKGSELPNWRLMNIFTDAPLKKLHWSIRSDNMRASIRPLVSQQKLRGSLIQVIEEVKLGFRRNVAPKLTMDGTGGTYILFDARRRPVGIFKPEDEEAFAPCNPRGYEGRIGQAGFRGGVLSGEGAGREYAAHILDSLYNCPAGIPPTTMVEACHPAFCYKSPVQLGTTGDHLMMNSYMAAAPENDAQTPAAMQLKWKAGSLQQFAQAKESCGDYNPLLFSVSDVHRIALFDIRVMNLDRNDGNILVAPLHTFQDITASLNRSESAGHEHVSGRLAQHQQKMMSRQLASKLLRSVSSVGCVGRPTGSDAAATHAATEAAHAAQSLVTPEGQQTKFRLIPIDHGLILPDVIDVATVDLVWFDWPQCKMPFSEHDLALVYSFNAERDAERLRRKLLMRDDCLRTLRLSTRFLQQCVRHHLNLHQIATIAARDDVDQPSALELLVRTSLQRAYLTMDCASLVSTNRLGFGMLDLAELKLLDESVLASLDGRPRRETSSGRSSRAASRGSAKASSGKETRRRDLSPSARRTCCACCCRHGPPSFAKRRDDEASGRRKSHRCGGCACKPKREDLATCDENSGRQANRQEGLSGVTTGASSFADRLPSAAKTVEGISKASSSECLAKFKTERASGRSESGEALCARSFSGSSAESFELEAVGQGRLRSSCTTSFSSLGGVRRSSSTYNWYQRGASGSDETKQTLDAPELANAAIPEEAAVGESRQSRALCRDSEATPCRRAFSSGRSQCEDRGSGTDGDLFDRREAAVCTPGCAAAVERRCDGFRTRCGRCDAQQGEGSDCGTCSRVAGRLSSDFSSESEESEESTANRCASGSTSSSRSSVSTPSRGGGLSDSSGSDDNDAGDENDEDESGYDSDEEADGARGRRTSCSGSEREEPRGKSEKLNTSHSAPVLHAAVTPHLRSLPSAAFFDYPPSMMEAQGAAKGEAGRRRRRKKARAKKPDAHDRERRSTEESDSRQQTRTKKEGKGEKETTHEKKEENVFDAVRGTQRGTVRRLNGTAAGTAYRRRKQQPHGVGSTWLLYDTDGRSIPLDWSEPRFDRLFFDCFEELLRKYIVQQHPEWASYPYKGSRLDAQLKKEKEAGERRTSEPVTKKNLKENATPAACCCDHGYHHCELLQAQRDEK